MSGQTVVEPPVANRQHQLLTEKSMRECAGSTAACAMVCCCCSPCVVMHFVVLAVYKLPTGLFRKAWRKNKKNRMIRKTTAKQIASSTEEVAEKEISLSRNGKSPAATDEERQRCEFHEEGEEKDGSCCGDAVDGFESDMWDQFREGGFWRSPLDGDSED